MDTHTRTHTHTHTHVCMYVCMYVCISQISHELAENYPRTPHPPDSTFQVLELHRGERLKSITRRFPTSQRSECHIQFHCDTQRKQHPPFHRGKTILF